MGSTSLFVGLRGRNREDKGLLAEAEADYLLARTLFPENRRLYMAQVGVSVQLSNRRFDIGEAGHHTVLANLRPTSSSSTGVALLSLVSTVDWVSDSDVR